MIFNFKRFHSATRNLDGPERMRIFNLLPADWQAAAWERLEAQLEGQRLLDKELDFPDRREIVVPIKRRQGAEPRQRDNDDALLTIDPPTYFAYLAGVDVPGGGATIRCPLPDHKDRTPSCHVYPDAAQGWYCFGCHRGGALYDLARELSGVGDRGEAFIELRRWTAERLLVEEAA
jgi:hypothetical protein